MQTLLAVAQSVSDEVRKQGKGVYFGAFYDPSHEVNLGQRWRDNDAREQATEECRRLLLVQVLDFVDWLKGQGVI